VLTLGDEDIRQLEIAVGDTLGMARVERMGDFDGLRQQKVALAGIAKGGKP